MLFRSLRGLLLSRLLFASLVSLLLLCRRWPIAANGLSLVDWGIRHWRSGRLVRWCIRHRYIGRRVGWPIRWRICYRRIGGPVSRDIRRLRVHRLLCVADRGRTGWTTRVQRRGFTRWRLLDQGLRCRYVRRPQALYFVDSQRLAGVLRQVLLLLGKWHRRRWRSCLCNHRTIDNCCRRTSHTISSRS